MIRLECYRIHEDATLPQIATIGSACFDVHAYIKPTIPVIVYGMNNKKAELLPLDGRIALNPGERVLVPTGLIFRIPFGISMRLHARSSVSLKKGLIMPNGEGIIDSDYHHETFVMLYNASADTVYIEDNERVAQGELVENNPADVWETFEKPGQTTERVGGFGSTGIK
jgi:dUTP pyrophosphatase|tara:strand:+ start:942 stop:1448 length:507 start_codon:yes stop_codon:yes gene_type:complete